MNDKNDEIREIFLGCDCWCLNHIAHLIYMPPTEREKAEGEEEVIYFIVKTENYYKAFLPPLHFYSKTDWQYFFRFHFFNRIGIALRYILNPIYTAEQGVLDCFDFQEKDLPALDNFLSRLTDSVPICISKPSYYMTNDRWRIIFDVWRLDGDFPWWLGWNIQFKRRRLLGRIWYALKYITGQHSDEQEFELTKREASALRTMIKWVNDKNKEKKESEKQEGKNSEQKNDPL